MIPPTTLMMTPLIFLFYLSAIATAGPVPAVGTPLNRRDARITAGTKYEYTDFTSPLSCLSWIVPLVMVCASIFFVFLVCSPRRPPALDIEKNKVQNAVNSIYSDAKGQDDLRSIDVYSPAPPPYDNNEKHHSIYDEKHQDEDDDDELDNIDKAEKKFSCVTIDVINSHITFYDNKTGHTRSVPLQKGELCGCYIRGKLEDGTTFIARPGLKEPWVKVDMYCYEPKCGEDCTVKEEYKKE